MILTMVLYGLAALIGLAAGLGVYLRWQASIATLPVAALFEVRTSEPASVSRGGGGWVVTAAKGVEPLTLRVGASHDALGDLLPLTRMNGHWCAPGNPDPLTRCYSAIALADGRTIQTWERVLPLEGAHNCRDLGGYSTADGWRIAWGRVYRADALHRLTDQDEAFLRNLGIRLVCDLRADDEVRREPERVPEGIAYERLPVFRRDPLGRRRAVLLRHRLDALFQRLYRTHIIDRGAPVLGTVFKRVADPANLPLLVHCTGGKDRTGVAAALLLHICGVPRATIVADYSLTNRAVEPLLDSLRASFAGFPALLGIKLEHFYPLLSARPALLEGAFDYIDATYGSVDAYLHGPAGLTEADVAAIRDNLLVGA